MGWESPALRQPSRAVLLILQASSTLTEFINKISCSSSSPRIFPKKMSVSVSTALREITQAPKGLQRSIQGRQSFSAQAIFFSLKMFSILLKCMK